MLGVLNLLFTGSDGQHDALLTMLLPSRQLCAHQGTQLPTVPALSGPGLVSVIFPSHSVLSTLKPARLSYSVREIRHIKDIHNFGSFEFTMNFWGHNSIISPEASRLG